MKNKLGKIVFALISVVITVALLYKIGVVNDVNNDVPIESLVGNTIPSFETMELTDDHKATQLFSPLHTYLKKIEIVILNVPDDEEGMLVYEITSDKGKEIVRKEVPLSSLQKGEWTSLYIEKALKTNQVYELSFYTENAGNTPGMLKIKTAMATPEVQALDGNADEADEQAILINYYYAKSLTMGITTFYCIFIFAIEIMLLCYLFVEDFFGKIKRMLYVDGVMRNSIYYLCTGFLIILAVFIHVYRLAEVPYGMHLDETSMAYDAWSFTKYGVDRYLKSCPAYLINYGGGQSVLYCYLATIAIKILGYSRTVIRIPGVINAFLIGFFGYKLVSFKWNNRETKVLFLSLFTILPIFLQITRLGLDCYMLAGMATVFLYLFVRAADSGKMNRYILCGISAGILLYSYALSYIAMLVFLLLAGIYLIYTKQVKWKPTIAFIVTLGIIALPLVLVQLTNIFNWPEWKLGFITITKLSTYRSDDLSLGHIPSSFVQCLKAIFLDDWLTYTSFPGYMTMYGVSLPFIALGFMDGIYQMIQSLRNKKWNLIVIVNIWFASMLFAGSLFFGRPTAYHVNGIFVCCIYYLISGLILAKELLRNVEWGKAFCVVIGCIYFISFVHFSDYYFNEYKDDIYPQHYFQADYQDVFAYMNDHFTPEKRNATIYIEEYNAMYFMATVLPSPYDCRFEDDMVGYQNYVFSLPDDIDPAASYIVKDTNKEYAINLEKNGFDIVKIGSWYLCYSE